MYLENRLMMFGCDGILKIYIKKQVSFFKICFGLHLACSMTRVAITVGLHHGYWNGAFIMLVH